MGLPDRSTRFLAPTGQFPAANLLNRLALAGSSKRNPNGFTDTAKHLCGVFTVTRRWLSMRDGGQTYLKPKDGGGVRVTQAVLGTKPLRDKTRGSAFPADVERETRAYQLHMLPARDALGGLRRRPGPAFTISVSLTTVPKIPRRRPAKPLRELAGIALPHGWRGYASTLHLCHHYCVPATSPAARAR